ncbi:hypothetical protein ABIA03_006680 [Bradyrhizobium yuanmingense]
MPPTFVTRLASSRAAQLVDIGDDDSRALAREQLDDGLAYAGGATRHQRDLALNLPCHAHSLFLLFGTVVFDRCRKTASHFSGSCVI